MNVRYVSSVQFAFYPLRIQSPSRKSNFFDLLDFFLRVSSSENRYASESVASVIVKRHLIMAALALAMSMKGNQDKHSFLK